MDVDELQTRLDGLLGVSADELATGLDELINELDLAPEEPMGAKEDAKAMEAQMADLRREVEEEKAAKKAAEAEQKAFLAKLAEDARKAGGKSI